MEHFPEFIANHLFLFSLLAGILMLLLWNLFGTVLSGIKEVVPMEATRMLNHEQAVMLDVRPEADYSGGHILNAINIPADKIAGQQDELKKYRGQPVILCCKNGIDSMRVARVIKQSEFEKVYCLKGGLQTWRSAGLPLARVPAADETA